jgi:hypothetical protein
VALASRWLPLALPFVVLLVAWWPSRRARFGIVDDHQIIALLDGHSRLPLGRLLPELFAPRTEHLGRFRPLFWAGQVVEAATAGDQPLWWYLDRLGLAALTLAGVLWACRQFVGPWPAALLAPAAVLGPQFEAWSRLGAAEAYAMPLFALGIAAMVRGARAQESRVLISGLGAVAASSFAKENFLPLAVGCVLFALLQLRSWGRARARTVAAGLGVVLLGDGLMIARQIARFGSQYSQERTPANAVEWTAYALENAFAFQALGVAMLLLLYRRHRMHRESWAVMIVAVGALALQVAFYAGADRVGRYLLPTTLCSVALWLVAWRASAEGGQAMGRFARAAALGALVASLALGAALSLRIAQGNAEATNRFQERLAAVQATIRAEHVRTIVLEPEDPYLDAELVMSLARYLHADADLTVMTTPSRPGTDARGRAIAASLTTLSAKGTSDGLLAPLDPPAGCLSLTFGQRPAVCARALPAPR